MAAYELHFHCPECKGTHHASFYLPFLDPNLDGTPLVEALRGQEPTPKVREITENGILCNNSHKTVRPDLDQFFLRAGLSSV